MGACGFDGEHCPLSHVQSASELVGDSSFSLLGRPETHCKIAILVDRQGFTVPSRFWCLQSAATKEGAVSREALHHSWIANSILFEANERVERILSNELSSN